VTKRCQGAGIGRLLLTAAIERVLTLGGSHLYLESHSSLKAALTLYESFGFVHAPRPSPSDYERSDVYMVYRPG
jgi:GNAT superfamily N-acetyltransferase